MKQLNISVIILLLSLFLFQPVSAGASMKRSRKVNGPLLIIGSALILLLFFVIKAMPSSPVVKGTVDPAISPSPDIEKTATYFASLPKFPTPVELSATPVIPTETSNLRPPQCTFPLAQITTTDPITEEYIFSEPQVVLNAAPGNSYNIVQWLPNNQQVLITEELRNSPEELENIELFDPETGETQLYAIRPITHEPPVWQTELNTIVYPVMNYYDIDKNAGTYKFTRQLWVGFGEPDSSQMLADNLQQLSIAIKADGSEMVYLSENKLYKLDKSLKILTSISIDSSQWDYAIERRDNHPVSYKMAWQPGTPLIYLYSEGAQMGGGYTFILNADTGQVCELSLGGWSLGAHWSSDGRYLAFIRVEDYSFLFAASDMVLLDTVTGNLTTVDVTPQETNGRHYVDDFIWAPDNRHLLAIGSVILSDSGQDESDIHGLYLVDSVSDRSVSVAPEYQIYVYPVDNNLAWSPDGSKLVVRCPTDTGNRICFISVQKTRPQ